MPITINEDGVLTKSPAGMTCGVRIRPDYCTEMIRHWGTDSFHIHMAMVVEGEEDFVLNTTQRHVDRNTIVIMTPNSTIEHLKWSPDFEVNFIEFDVEHLDRIANFIHPTAVEGTERDLSGDVPPMLMIEGQGYMLQFSGAETDIGRSIFASMEKALRLGHPRTALVMLAGLIDLGKQILIKSQSTMTRPTLSLLNRFLILVHTHCNQQRTLDFYAQELCMHKNYLSEIIGKTSEMTASKWIEYVTAIKIKRLLADTGLTVNQIANRMNFPEPQNMTRYFKRVTGLTPNEYRRKVREGSSF